MLLQRTTLAWLVAAVTAASAASAGAGTASPTSSPPAPAAAPVPARRAQLGVAAIEISPELRAHFGAPSDRGVLVDRVAPGSAAEHAGIRVGDLVLEIAGQPTSSARDMRAALRAHAKGDRVGVVVLRDGKRLELTATLDAAPPAAVLPGGVLGELREAFPGIDRDFPDLVMPGSDQQLQDMLERAREMFRHMQPERQPGERT